MVCIKCMHNVYNNENVNPESIPKSQELSYSNSLVSSSSSSIFSENAVLTDSLPPSQIPERLLESDTVAKDLPEDLNSSIFYSMLPPEKFSQYRNIISVLAPQSIKRERIWFLHQVIWCICGVSKWCSTHCWTLQISPKINDESCGLIHRLQKMSKNIQGCIFGSF